MIGRPTFDEPKGKRLSACKTYHILRDDSFFFWDWCWSCTMNTWTPLAASLISGGAWTKLYCAISQAMKLLLSNYHCFLLWWFWCLEHSPRVANWWTQISYHLYYIYPAITQNTSLTTLNDWPHNFFFSQINFGDNFSTFSLLIIIYDLLLLAYNKSNVNNGPK